MGISSNVTTQSLNAYFNKVAIIVREEMLRTFSYIGEKSVTRIRDRKESESWIDHTGNLRSSIGYAISEYGKEQIRSAFEVVRQGTEGSEEGAKLLSELLGQYSQSYALIVVAGMSYAEYVEAKESKDVLASSFHNTKTLRL